MSNREPEDMALERLRDDESEFDRPCRHMYLSKHFVPAEARMFNIEGGTTFQGRFDPVNGVFISPNMWSGWSRLYTQPLQELYVIRGTSEVLGQVTITGAS